MQDTDLKHSERRLSDQSGWVIYLSHDQPERLVVFVHGFGGEAVETWESFEASGLIGDWWREADMLFVGYDSKRDNITGTAHRLRRELPTFYPRIPQKLLHVGEAWVRARSGRRYRELVLVGHSLGGVVIRRALCDTAERWLEERKDDPSLARPPLLDARVCLFSPASAGFRAAGFLGLWRATPLWVAVEMFAQRSSAYTDLQQGSKLLVETQARTEELAKDPELSALRASILWANPDNVVMTLRYQTDLPDDSIDEQDHSSVCKPGGHYEAPWSFVERGRID